MIASLIKPRRYSSCEYMLQAAMHLKLLNPTGLFQSGGPS
jgi:hypothetical protein